MHVVLKDRINLPGETKETEFFRTRYERGFDWYLDYFKDSDPSRATGEFCPTYFTSDLARERIAKDLPRCKIICSFRDPVERAYSYYRLMANNVWTRDEFADAITSNRDLRESCRYGHYLRKWIEQFGKDNVLPVVIEDLEDDPQALMDRMCDFIRTPRFVLAESPFARQRVKAMRTSAPRNLKLARRARKVIGWLKDRRFHRSALALRESAVGRFFFEGGEIRPVSSEVEGRLREYFRPEVEALEEILGRDLSVWKRARSVLGAAAVKANFADDAGSENGDLVLQESSGLNT